MIKELAALSDWETHQLNIIPRQCFWRQWRAATFGFALHSGLQRRQSAQILSYGVCPYLQCGFFMFI